MKIFYDHMIFARQKYGGISKYFCELIKQIPQENWYCSTVLSNNQYLHEMGYKTIPFLPNLNFNGKERIMHELGFLYTVFKLKTTPWNIFHPSTLCAKYNNVIPSNKPMVITAHDVLYCLFHENNPKRDWLIEMDRKAAQRADAIIAISENTKKDYIQHFGVNEEKITVIHHGIDTNKQTIYSQRIEPNPYILFVGLRYDYKNFSRLIKSFALISRKYPDLKLICTGFQFSNEEKNEFEHLTISDKVRLVLASEQEMAQLYHDAEMFVFPSIYEGFGMPILEAMVYDCPVVLSNTSCFPEIAQQAGIYFDPYRIEDIAEKMEKILLDTALREKQIALGQERLTHFSWSKCANEHIKVYQSLL